MIDQFDWPAVWVLNLLDHVPGENLEITLAFRDT